MGDTILSGKLRYGQVGPFITGTPDHVLTMHADGITTSFQPVPTAPTTIEPLSTFLYVDDGQAPAVPNGSIATPFVDVDGALLAYLARGDDLGGTIGIASYSDSVTPLDAGALDTVIYQALALQGVDGGVQTGPPSFYVRLGVLTSDAGTIRVVGCDVAFIEEVPSIDAGQVEVLQGAVINGEIISSGLVAGESSTFGGDITAATSASFVSCKWQGALLVTAPSISVDLYSWETALIAGVTFSTPPTVLGTPPATFLALVSADLTFDTGAHDNAFEPLTGAVVADFTLTSRPAGAWTLGNNALLTYTGPDITVDVYLTGTIETTLPGFPSFSVAKNGDLVGQAVQSAAALAAGANLTRHQAAFNGVTGEYNLSAWRRVTLTSGNTLQIVAASDFAAATQNISFQGFSMSIVKVPP